MLHQFFWGIQACGFRPSLGVDRKGFESWFACAARISELVDSLFKAPRSKGTGRRGSKLRAREILKWYKQNSINGKT
jgi:hypothetical protein